MKQTYRKTIILTMLFGGLLGGGLALFSGKLMPAVNAEKESAASAPRCSLRTVEGAYEIGFTGSFNGIGPVATLGTIRLDGAGSFEVADTASFNGTLVNRVGAGTYTVAADCTGSATVTYTVGQPGRTATFNMVITERGDDVRLIGTTPGGIVSGSAKPIS